MFVELQCDKYSVLIYDTLSVAIVETGLETICIEDHLCKRLTLNYLSQNKISTLFQGNEPA